MKVQELSERNVLDNWAAFPVKVGNLRYVLIPGMFGCGSYKWVLFSFLFLFFLIFSLLRFSFGGGMNSGVTVWMREKSLTVEMKDGGLHGRLRMLRKMEINDLSNSMFELTSFNMEVESWVYVSPLRFSNLD